MFRPFLSRCSFKRRRTSLGSSPVVQDEEVEIEQQFEERDISTEPLSLEELRTAKKKITEGKHPGMTEFNLKS